MQLNVDHISARDGAEEDFDPARQARFALENETLHRGLATESLVESLLNAGTEVADVMEVAQSEADRRLLATILLKEDEELTAERVEGALRALRRIHYRRRLEQVQQELQTKRGREASELQALLDEKLRLKRALMHAGLAEGGSAPAA
jgi:hypothetical protein